MLLCELGYTGMGTVLASLDLLDLARGEVLRQQLFSLADTSGSCLPDGRVQQLLAWNAADLNHDGLPDLQVRVQSGTFHLGPFRADSDCAEVPNTVPRRTFVLDYLWTGVRFTPTRATTQALDSLRADNPDLLTP